MKISSPKNIDAYVMMGQAGNMSGPSPPDHLFALVSAEKYIYIVKKQLKESIKELPQCKAAWDSIGFGKFDIAFEHYRKCYQKELSSDLQFEAIQKTIGTHG